MAITETHQPALDAPAADDAGHASTSGFPHHHGIAGVLGTGEHTTIGRLYIGCSLAFGVAMLVLFAMFDANGISTVSVLNTDAATGAFTLSQLGIVLLFLMPLFIGIATVVTPLQVGARTVAFPRAAAAAFWAWLIAGLGFVASYIPGVDGGINMAYESKDGSLLTLLSLLGICAALLLATVCVMTTIVTLRTAGMHLDQVPLFSWSMLVAGGIWLLTVPVFMGNVALVFMDAKYGAPALFGVASQQWSQLAWFVTQPQAFAFAIPLLGIAGDVIVTFAKVRQPQRGAVLFGIGLFGALSMGAYAQPHFFESVYLQWIFVAQCFLLGLPVLIVLGGYANALRKGKPKMAGPALAALISMLLLLLACAAAAPFGIGRLGLQFTPTDMVEGNQALRIATAGAPIYAWGVYLMVVGAALVGAIAGLSYWSPKISGKTMAGVIPMALALLAGVATLAAGAPLLALGAASKVEGMVDARDGLFALAAAGAAGLALAALVIFVSTVASRVSVISNGSTTEPDAWGIGQTLEWVADSPPSPGNFGALEHVDSPEPLLDLAGDDAADTEGAD